MYRHTVPENVTGRLYLFTFCVMEIGELERFELLEANMSHFCQGSKTFRIDYVCRFNGFTCNIFDVTVFIDQ